MHYAGAVAHGYVIVADDEVRLYLSRRGRNSLYFNCGFGKERLVLESFPFLADLFGNYLILFEELRNESLCKDISYAVRFYFEIGLVGVDAQRDVGRERPRSGRPSQNIAVFRALYLKAGYGGIFLYRFVALRHFVRRKSRAATGAIGYYFMTLIQQSLLVHLL